MSKYIFFALYILFFLTGIYLRFSFLDWGKPYFFHPDENNIIFAILKLSPTQWNPHFFAYGGLPIYVTYITTFLFTVKESSFTSIAYTLRCISASLSLLLIPSLFYIGIKLYNKRVGFFAAFLATFSVGFIQFAHFGTFEMWLTFFTLWFFYCCFLLWKNPSLKLALLCGILAGALIGTKVSSSIFLPIPPLLFFLKLGLKKKFFLYLSLYLAALILIFSITNPFFYLDTNTFMNAIAYESSVATGLIHVFYTQSFLHTVPVLFQLQFILPFLLNPLVFVFFLFSLTVLFFQTTKKRNIQDMLLLFFFFCTFFSQTFLFVKWTRYMVPTLPFIYLIVATILDRQKKQVLLPLTIILFSISIATSLAFFYVVYPTDSRIAAAVTRYSKLPTVIEPYDIGAIAFTNTFPVSKTINVYDVDTDAVIQNDLESEMSDAVIFLSPSQRLIHTRLKNKNDFPLGNKFYTDLVSGKSGFHIAYQTPCTIWCKIVYLGDPIHNVEETATVFDHPVVTVFKKQL